MREASVLRAAQLDDVAGGEEQRRFLAVQIGKLALQDDVIVVGAGDVARAAGTGTTFVDRLVHCLGHDLALSHAEIVVGAPHGDVVLPLRSMPHGGRKGAALALQLGEHPVVALFAQSVQGASEMLFKIHGLPPT